MTAVNRSSDGYRPGRPIEPGPLFAWPPRPRATLTWLFGFPGYLWPWNLGYLFIAIGTWFLLQPSMNEMSTLRPAWVSLLLARNLVLMAIVYGGWHVWFYRYRRQSDRFKYNSRWLSTSGRKFLFGNQLWDNMFWSGTSGLLVWTGYEVLYFWAAANGKVPTLDLGDRPVLGAVMFIALPLWRLAHFYAVHRLLHWDRLYKPVHSLHHKNINVGPWSGLAMHPVEHLIYFSCVAVHLIVPSHPLHFLFNSQHAALSPAQSHSGFDQVELGPRRVGTGAYFHQLHHAYFECNYGDPPIPADKWAGTFHDGTEEAHEAMRERRRAARARRR